MGFLCKIAAFGCLFGEFFQSLEKPEEVSHFKVLMEWFTETLEVAASFMRNFMQQPIEGSFGSIIRYETVVSPTFKPSTQAIPPLKK